MGLTGRSESRVRSFGVELAHAPFTRLVCESSCSNCASSERHDAVSFEHVLGVPLLGFLFFRRDLLTLQRMTSTSSYALSSSGIASRRSMRLNLTVSVVTSQGGVSFVRSRASIPTSGTASETCSKHNISIGANSTDFLFYGNTVSFTSDD